jgi:hypothetical protein
MAFVWSRLALAAVLAAGAACAPAEACPEALRLASLAQGERGAGADCCDAPRLVCSEGASYVLFDGCDGFGSATVSDAPRVAHVPRHAIGPGDLHVPAAPLARADVLVVAPKTSPPQT